MVDERLYSTVLILLDRGLRTKLFAILDRSFGGYSPRAGGATFYASLGLPEDTIQALGRWSSKAWKTYIRDNPTKRTPDFRGSCRYATAWIGHKSF